MNRLIERIGDWWDGLHDEGRRQVYYTAWFAFGFVVGAISL